LAVIVAEIFQDLRNEKLVLGRFLLVFFDKIYRIDRIAEKGVEVKRKVRERVIFPPDRLDIFFKKS